MWYLILRLWGYVTEDWPPGPRWQAHHQIFIGDSMKYDPLPYTAPVERVKWWEGNMIGYQRNNDRIPVPRATPFTGNDVSPATYFIKNADHCSPRVTPWCLRSEHTPDVSSVYIVCTVSTQSGHMWLIGQDRFRWYHVHHKVASCIHPRPANNCSISRPGRYYSYRLWHILSQTFSPFSHNRTWNPEHRCPPWHEIGVFLPQNTATTAPSTRKASKAVRPSIHRTSKDKAGPVYGGRSCNPTIQTDGRTNIADRCERRRHRLLYWPKRV